jgi:hypothetical protein
VTHTNSIFQGSFCDRAINSGRGLLDGQGSGSGLGFGARSRGYAKFLTLLGRCACMRLRRLVIRCVRG